MAALALESSYRYQYSRSKKTGRHVHDHRISLCISRTVDHTQPNGHLEWVCTRRLCSCEVRILRGSHSVRRARTSPPPKAICSWATHFPICLQWQKGDKVRCPLFLQTPIIPKNSTEVSFPNHLLPASPWSSLALLNFFLPVIYQNRNKLNTCNKHP